jgi:tight adherence protein C
VLTASLVALFICVAVTTAFATMRVIAWNAPERKRLRDVAGPAASVARESLTDTPDPALRKLSMALPKSAKEMRQLRRQLVAAGHYNLSAAVYFSAAKVAGPVILGAVPLLLLGTSDGLLLAAVAAVLGYLLPDLVLARQTRARKKLIENGLPDALDLLIVCMEAGSSLDQAIVKASDELEVAHPVLAHELRLITTEIRASVPRLDAFGNFARRTDVEDVRELVTMLRQTDRFGTSLTQALRIHAETSRTRRRQRAEERAAKIGVKLVFPLVMCVFPAVYVVCIGSAVVAIYNTFVK